MQSGMETLSALSYERLQSIGEVTQRSNINAIQSLSLCECNADMDRRSNGKTNGITLPSAYGQEDVIRKAYKRAGLGLDETDYVEVSRTKKSPKKQA